MRLLLFFLTVFFLSACGTDSTESNQSTAPISLNWHLIENGQNAEKRQRQLAAFTIKNVGITPLGNNWAIYFNQNNEPIRDSVVVDGINIKHINGDLYQISPAITYQVIGVGESRRIEYEGNNWSIKNSDAPAGLYAVFQDATGKEQVPQLLNNYTFTPFISPKQINRNKADSFPIPTPAYRYEQNKKLTKLASSAILPVLPTPQKVVQKDGSLSLTSQYTLCYSEELQNERNYLLAIFESLGLSIKDYKGGNCAEQSIELRLIGTPVIGQQKENYQLDINPTTQQIIIEGTDAAGVFYGIQSLRSLLPIEKEDQTIDLPAIAITDAPRFVYRGMHLDVARNFQSKQSVEKLLEGMATYKLNKLHFHLSDDEGWRVEIPGLPELTSVGAIRGHSLEERTHLQPAYGSGPFTKNATSAGSGFYTRSEYIDLLRYAKERHIEVIPEIDLPGHARAAIKAMEARYHRLQEAGNTAAAEEYLLSDPSDSSTYRSVQGYKDNTTCVCQESLYTFLEKVVDEIMGMHEEAGLPLQVVHTGGDEVPNGVWEGSPNCATLLAANAGIEGTKEGLTKYFLQRFHQILTKRQLVTGGWEEIALTTEQQGEHKAHVPNPAFVKSNFLAYVWNSVFGWGGEDIAYQLANAGYPVVLSNASNLYFDLAYDKDPQIKGLYWAGFVDTRKAYEFEPHNLFQTASMGRMGGLLNRDQLAAGKTALTEEGKKNVLGLQGQLWSETLTTPKRLEESTFPKLLGLAERAWATAPDWATTSSIQETQLQLEKDWNQFANTVGQKEFLRLNTIAGGFQYHIPPPGAIIKDGLLMANAAYPGVEIRYTLDGSEPTTNSKIYLEPVKIKGEVRLKAFAGKNSSNEVLVK